MYFGLADVARVARAPLRVGATQAVLGARGRSVELRRDSARVVVNGRPTTLGAVVRARRGVWQVPGEFVARVMPMLVGNGVQFSVVAGLPPARPADRAVALASFPPAPVAPPPPAAVRDEAATVSRRPGPPPPSPAPIVREAATPDPSPARGDVDPAENAPPGAVRAGPVELRYRSYPTFTRVVLEGAAPFEPRLVESRGALVVPLAGLQGRAPRATRTVRDGLVSTLDLAESRGQVALRVTFDQPPAGRKVYRLQDPPRLVLDFERPATTPAAAPAARSSGLRTIVIDAGHGGHDPGAIGPAGLQEKELTLDIARRLAALVQEELGLKAALTRTRDQFLPLRERTAFANRERADLFLSVHVNAASGATATGTETYFLSSEATDNAARAAAAFENKVIALEPGRASGSRDLVRSILWDLAQSEFQQESSRLAEALQDSLDGALRRPSRGVKQAPFYVLGGAAMPAVLVEIGFITNPQEEHRLQDEGYRERIARALAAGVAQYKRHYDRKSGVVAGR